MEPLATDTPNPKKPVVAAFLWTSAYLLCSSTMLVINKLTVNYLAMPMFLLTLQTLASVGILLVGRVFGVYSFAGFSSTKAQAWLGVVFAWALPVIINMKALQYTTIETVIVFRILATFGVAGGEVLFFGATFSMPALAAMFFTVAGGVVYGYSDSNFTLLGYFWGFLYFAATVYNSLYIKSKFNQTSTTMSNTEKTYYNNIISTPVLLVLSLATESFEWQRTMLTGEIMWMSVWGVLVILLSCFMGTAISVCGTQCRDVLSATSFTIAGNVNKFITVGISVLAMGTPISATSAIGLVVALTGGAAYAMATTKT